MRDDSAPYQTVKHVLWTIPVVEWDLTPSQFEIALFIFLPLCLGVHAMVKDENWKFGLIGVIIVVGILVLFFRPNKRHFVRYLRVMAGFHLITPRRYVRQATDRRVTYYTRREPFIRRAWTKINIILEGGID
jgi:hypothetical protein